MKTKIAIIGLGYVGLPLAVEFVKKFETIGFDIDKARIQQLKQGKDSTLEVELEDLKLATLLSYTANIDEIKDCNIYIVAVPTPVNKHKQPDFTAIIKSSQLIGKIISKDDIVIYESTFYPGATEEVCVPILEQQSGLKFNKDFYCGYSPERINPGDKKHRITNIKKVTSGSTPEIADIVDALYQKIITEGTHKVSTIQVAEAAKVIENIQRDMNIALINEFALIFNRLNIDTEEVLKAAGSKWNFLPFRPGLVGGHCIGVDPYYLTYKAIKSGYYPEIILAGRRLNDNMSNYVANEVLMLMIKKRINLVDANILIMGITFKENCPDFRNSLAIDLIEVLKKFRCNVDIYDPWIEKSDFKSKHNMLPIEIITEGKYDAIILTVAHDEFKKMEIATLKKYCKPTHVIYDIKYIFPRDKVDGRL